MSDRNGYIRTIYGTHTHTDDDDDDDDDNDNNDDDDDDDDNDTLIYKPIGPTARKSVQGRLLYHL